MARSDWDVVPLMMPDEQTVPEMQNLGFEKSVVPQIDNGQPGDSSLQLKMVEPTPFTPHGGCTVFIRTDNPSSLGTEGVSVSFYLKLDKETLMTESPPGLDEAQVFFRLPLLSNIQDENDMFNFVLDLISDGDPTPYQIDSGFTIGSFEGNAIVFPVLAEPEEGFDTPPDISDWVLFDINDSEQPSELVLQFENYAIQTDTYVYELGSRILNGSAQLGPAVRLILDLEEVATELGVSLSEIPSFLGDLMNPSRKLGFLFFGSSQYETTLTIDDLVVSTASERPDWDESTVVEGSLAKIIAGVQFSPL